MGMGEGNGDDFPRRCGFGARWIKRRGRYIENVAGGLKYMCE